MLETQKYQPSYENLRWKSKEVEQELDRDTSGKEMDKQAVCQNVGQEIVLEIHCGGGTWLILVSSPLLHFHNSIRW